MTTEIETEAARLFGEWEAKLAAHKLNPADDDASAAEYDAWDALVEFVEVNDLNFSKWDPRGPEEVVDDAADEQDDPRLHGSPPTGPLT